MTRLDAFRDTLLLFTPFLVLICTMSSEALALKVGLLLTMGLCHLNLHLQSIPFQEVLHAVFVFFIVHGATRSVCRLWRMLDCFVITCMLYLRRVYDACVFLWWKPAPRNVDVDLIGYGLLACLLCRRPRRIWLSWSLVLLVAVLSHLFRNNDAAGDSFLLLMLENEEEVHEL